MTSAIQLFCGPVVQSVVIGVPDFNVANGPETLAIERLATEPIGTTTLTLTNVAVGSRYRIERQADGSLATPTGNAEGVAGAATVALTLDYYAPGSANNNLRVKVRKGTGSPRYQPFETQVTVGAAAQSVFVAQVADTIAQ